MAPNRQPEYDVDDKLGVGHQIKAGNQLCVICKEWYPTTMHYWEEDANSPSGFRHVCRLCTQEVAEAKEAKGILEQIKEFDQATMNGVQLLLTKRGQQVPHLADLVESMMNVTRGTDGLSKLWLTQYMAAPAGSQTRTRLLSMACQLIKDNSAAGGATRETDHMDDEQVQAELKQQLRLLLQEDEEQSQSA